MDDTRQQQNAKDQSVYVKSDNELVQPSANGARQNKKGIKIVIIAVVVVLAIAAGVIFFMHLKCQNADSDMINVSVGDVVTYGSYEQDNNAINGKEPIEWIVLDKNSSSVLLISKYVLDSQEYRDNASTVVWNYSDVREWLNNKFLNTAFTATEQTRIEIITPENETSKDQIFLLSGQEVERYFGNKADRVTTFTPYAEKQSDSVSWWTRTSPSEYKIMAINNDGGYSLLFAGTREGVRPAMWISIE